MEHIKVSDGQYMRTSSGIQKVIDCEFSCNVTVFVPDGDTADRYFFNARRFRIPLLKDKNPEDVETWNQIEVVDGAFAGYRGFFRYVVLAGDKDK